MKNGRHVPSIFLDHGEKVFHDGLGAFLHSALNPPFQCFHKGGCDMIFPERIGNTAAFARLEQRKLALDQKLQIASKISQEQLVVPGGQQSQNIVVIFLQMLQKMQKGCIGAAAIKNMPVLLLVVLCVEYMAKQLLAKFLQQKIFGLKMRIESGPADISAVYDLAYGDLIKVPLGEQLGKCVKYGFPGFSLASVHMLPPYILCNLFSNE